MRKVLFSAKASPGSRSPWEVLITASCKENCPQGLNLVVMVMRNGGGDWDYFVSDWIGFDPAEVVKGWGELWL